jgi:chromate transport protein ChrA
MHYALNLIRFGFLPAVFAFLVWRYVFKSFFSSRLPTTKYTCSLPGAFGMYGLSIAVSHIGDTVPSQAYALLSGLNAATVGIVLLAAVQLSQKSITDKVTRILVFLGASAGLLYNALWYFPLLMFLAGCVTVVYDYRFLHGPIKWVMQLFKRKRSNPAAEVGAEMGEVSPQNAESPMEVEQPSATTSSGLPAPAPAHTRPASKETPSSELPVSAPEAANERTTTRRVPEDRVLDVSWQMGVIIISGFFVTFIVFMILRGVLKNPSLLYSLFANMYLAGTIIFGGGPVVIPLLREYVVEEGWVSPRDFLIGLAIIQAFPGPNFNFAVYLGSLTAIGGGYVSAWGAIVAYFGIFVPGLVTVHGEMGLWSAMRGKRWVRSALRGINAAAVGLIYTAVYRLWQIGYIDQDFQSGNPLGDDPWWVVVTATSYVGGYWFGLNAPMAIVLGAIMGLIRYGVVNK